MRRFRPPSPSGAHQVQGGRWRSRPRAAAGFLWRLMMFVLVSAVAGVLVAGLALPVAGGIGYVARGGSETFDSQLVSLETTPLAQRTRVLAADGTLLATFFSQNRVAVPLSDIAPVMRRAIVAIEDSRFYEHGGVDLRGTARALVNNLQTARTQGGSTITQQYVKNALQQAALAKGDAEAARAAVEQKGAAGYQRKLRELGYSLALEDELTKDQILERYLNIAYFGNGAYGVEAAAQRYFGKSAKTLAVDEAAMIAGLVQNPVRYDPLRRPEVARARRDTVIQRMVDVKALAARTGRAARRTKLGLDPKVLRNGCTTSFAPFFCDYVQRLISSDPTFGASREERVRLLLGGGLTITTTIDPKAQAAAQEALRDKIDPTDQVAGTMVMVDPGTFQVKAMAVSRGFGSGRGRTSINLAAGLRSGGSNGVQPGSAFKPFLALEALKQGYGFDYTIDSPYQLEEVEPIEDCAGNKAYDPDYAPKNESRREDGSYTMARAMEESVNTYFIQLEKLTGLCEASRRTEQMGVRRADGSPLEILQTWPLGTNTVSPLSMAEAYATFAARGRHCTTTVITKVVDRNGKDLPVPQAKCEQLFEPELADAINAMLSGVVQKGTGRNAAIGRPQAGKTGTHERITAWYVGYTPQMAAAVAVWNPSPGNSAYRLENRTIGGEFYESVQGANLPAPIWAAAMRDALEGVPASRFVAPLPKYLKGEKGPGLVTGLPPGLVLPDGTVVPDPRATGRCPPACAAGSGSCASARRTRASAPATCSTTSPGGTSASRAAHLAVSPRRRGQVAT